ncbi:hypothetical protein AA0323_1453 [Asaia siamensis NRIC 0323]|nr:hypothetical protein AA0323_1453 [Asaia siamensis NRIC 0323]
MKGLKIAQNEHDERVYLGCDKDRAKHGLCPGAEIQRLGKAPAQVSERDDDR